MKQYKYDFWASKVEYFGHIIIREGVRVDSMKVIAMQYWPHPKTLKILHGFLGLISYYRKFVKVYGKIVAPLTLLTKKNAFIWGDETKQVFLSLKDVMCMTLVLAMENFTNTYFSECDALSKGLGEILMQEGHPLTFTSKKLCDRNFVKSTCEKEMMDILHAIET
jgi:hypothetical protein